VGLSQEDLSIEQLIAAEHSWCDSRITSDLHVEGKPSKPPLEIVLSPSDSAVKKECTVI